MPELPEVETVRRSLEKHLLGRIITEVIINKSKIIKFPEPEKFKFLLEGDKINSLGRRGKYLLFCLKSGYTWVTHLRMTGQFYYVKPEESLLKHTHLIFELDNGYQLRYVDIRQFGTMYLLRPEEFKLIKGLRDLGPEPLSNGLSFDRFCRLLEGRRGALKQLLLDQTFLAGIGNIYADEILFDAGLHPKRLVSSLSLQEKKALLKSIQKMLQLGIENRGTSFRNYVDGDGRKGSFQELLKVYGRGGEACCKCGQPLTKQKIAGRSTCFCSTCQK
ncbi:MAG: bifunctional DNA-formamidopyrimidine glycosylase/DNA-(apurinic or apyrimidinic site) lyase [Zhaonellaceae bacterium]|jgi:formamidopyrimidine-DNA glycosylase|nr:bifunctional DNA-formamidopyrimidine glycosylase/DNA-(apurinic or apyrimidinic site) lyase [Clostridia bacterium]